MRVLVVSHTKKLGRGQIGPNLYNEAKRLGKEVQLVHLEPETTSIKNQLDNFKPDWVFCFPIAQKHVKIYEEIRTRGVRLLFWYPDQLNTARFGTLKSLIKHCNIMVSSNLDTAQQLQKCSNWSVWVPQYFDVNFCRNKEGQLPPRNLKYDLCFIGVVDKRRKEFLNKLKNDYSCKFVTHDPGKLNEIRGYQMAEAYAQSKIAINIQRQGFIDTGPFKTSNRAFNAMGSGAFFLNHEVDKLDLIWKNGYHCVTYNHTFDDLKEKIDYYLEHKNEREQIAKTGKQNVLQDHSLEQRIHEYWNLMIEYDKKKSNLYLWYKHNCVGKVKKLRIS